MKLPKLGAHVSIAGGILKSLQRAEKIGAECIQIFAGSPRRYEVLLPEKKEIIEYKEELKRKKISPVYVHASYLINLASEEEKILKKSRESILNSLRFASLIGAEGVVYHPGSPKGKEKRKAIEREAKNVNIILEKSPKEVFLIIENTAGTKKIGKDPAEVGYLFRKISSEKVRVCIDTAHSFESGNIKKFNKNDIEKWLLRWKIEVGFENISLFHINDSLTAFNSQNDRHANIGEGEIGKKGFQLLMTFKEVASLPWILEVPGFEKNGPDKKNLDILKKMRDNIK